MFFIHVEGIFGKTKYKKHIEKKEKEKRNGRFMVVLCDWVGSTDYSKRYSDWKRKTGFLECISSYCLSFCNDLLSCLGENLWSN